MKTTFQRQKLAPKKGFREGDKGIGYSGIGKNEGGGGEKKLIRPRGRVRKSPGQVKAKGGLLTLTRKGRPK